MPILGLAVVGAGGRHWRHVLDRADSDRIQIENRVADDVVRLRLLRKCYDYAALANDPHLLTGDLPDRVPEKFLMIEGDVGDDADNGFDDVRGVQAAAHSNLEDGDFDFLLREMVEGDRGYHLEKTGMPRQFPFGNQTQGDVLDLAMDAGKAVVIDL